MSTGPNDSALFSERTALIVLATVSVGLGFVILRPYLQYVLLAFVLAYVLYPAQRRLERYLSAMQAALLLTLAAVLIVVLPLAYVLWLAFQEGMALMRAFERGDIEIGAIERQLEEYSLGADIRVVYETYREPIIGAVENVAFGTLDIVLSLPSLFIGLTVLLFVLFSLLRDGQRLVTWARHVTPFRGEIQDEFFEELDNLMWASVVGNAAVAGIQAILLGVGLFLLGFDNVVFLTVATFVLALLPLVGAFVVWLPISLYLFALGSTTSAVILFLYGSLVSVSDFYLRPAVIGHSGALNSAIVVVGIFGGIVVFGTVGLFIGPVILGGTKLVIDVLSRERQVVEG